MLADRDNNHISNHRDSMVKRFLKGVASIITLGIYCLFSGKTPQKIKSTCGSFQLFKPRGALFKQEASRMIDANINHSV